MPELNLAQLAEATGGTILRGEPQTRVHSYTIDSRRLDVGGVFFALRGRRSDGHRFLGEAGRAGAAVAVIEEEQAADASAPPALIRVENVEASLLACASWIRKKFSSVRWIALTGSNGKTTTKELIADGLSANRRVHRTPGNLNNHLGVPLTLLKMPDQAEMAVIEMAMSGAEEIATLMRAVDPDIGLVTNIRAVHMASFNSIDDVAAAKGELFALLRREATSVVNLDDLHVRVQATRHDGERVTFGQHTEADLRLEQIENRFVPGAAMKVRHGDDVMQIQLRMGGAHSAQNALAALAVVLAAGGDLPAAAERMEQLEAGTGRGKVLFLRRGVQVVDDSYNCSPPALASVLETMRVSEPAGRRVLVLGDMTELGDMEAALHKEAGRRAAQAGVSLLFAVGQRARDTAVAARRAGVPEVHHHANSVEAANAIAEFIRDGDLIVVKGSRSMRMGRVVRALTESLGEAN